MKTSRMWNLLFIALWSILPLTSYAAQVFWVDVREPVVYEQRHVTGAVNIPHYKISEQISSLTTNKDAEIFLYCRSGRRSGLAMEDLQEMGYTNVINVGGIEAALELQAMPSP